MLPIEGHEAFNAGACKGMGKFLKTLMCCIVVTYLVFSARDDTFIIYAVAVSEESENCVEGVTGLLCLSFH